MIGLFLSAIWQGSLSHETVSWEQQTDSLSQAKFYDTMTLVNERSVLLISVLINPVVFWYFCCFDVVYCLILILFNCMFYLLLMYPHCESSLLWRMPYTSTKISMDYSSFRYYSNIKRDSEAYRLGRREAYKSWRISGLPPFYSSTVLQNKLCS